MLHDSLTPGQIISLRRNTMLSILPLETAILNHDCKQPNKNCMRPPFTHTSSSKTPHISRKFIIKRKKWSEYSLPISLAVPYGWNIYFNTTYALPSNRFTRNRKTQRYHCTNIDLKWLAHLFHQCNPTITTLLTYPLIFSLNLFLTLSYHYCYYYSCIFLCRYE